MNVMKFSASALALMALSATAAAARDNIQVAGSSTVLPYATIVAQAFAENTSFPAPVVEGGGSSAGLKQFCEGAGEKDVGMGLSFFSSRRPPRANSASMREISRSISSSVRVRSGSGPLITSVASSSSRPATTST